ncbi:MAG: DUF1343 domain-containing protein [Deltaproteobacteria bacterium]|nr:MAG: DUF1343 domain-containing protein [Deltaproteobacteria bacterium]
MLSVGLEYLREEPRRFIMEGERLGLLYNAASVDARLLLSRDVVSEVAGDDLYTLFGPQHGVSSDVQDNMVETDHAVDPRLDIPCYSLYGETRKPTPEMLEGLDTIIVDLQDVGTRVYTYIWTLRLLMEACGEAGVKVLILDRPNPIGGAKVEGSLLEQEFLSFVGMEPIPMRHGMTIGELAIWFLRCRGVECSVEVVPLRGYRRDKFWREFGREWVLTSPNLPTFDSASVYPGTVLLEGTNASEGRGTTRPFELVGGPWGQSGDLAKVMEGQGLPGVRFRPHDFQPTFQKWGGVTVNGMQLHVTNPVEFSPWLTGLVLLRELWGLYKDAGFWWNEPPYEYEEDMLPIHMLLGSSSLREMIEAGAPNGELNEFGREGLLSFMEERAECLIY